MIDIINKIALEAGKAIMEIYNSADFGVEMKSDNSPLTLADKAAHDIIEKKLKENFPEIPILSEEGKDIPFEERKNWDKFWLVDPLDGTKEFIKKNGEFTVNIALIDKGIPKLGVIYAPALEYKNRKTEVQSEESKESSIPIEVEESKNKFSGILYFTDGKNGSFKQSANHNLEKISVIPKDNDLIAVQSRSHSCEEEQILLKENKVTDSISVGSSLKFCMVAEGKAQIYYRHGPTNEWDVGAGHAIVVGAGGKVEGLSYNKEKILNSSFLATAK